MVAEKLTAIGWERDVGYPSSYRYPDTLLVLDTHMDDWHGCGRMKEATGQLELLRKAFRLNGTDGFIHGSYNHLKRFRIKGPEGTFVRANEKHIRGVEIALGLTEANIAKSTSLEEERPELDPLVSEEKKRLYRSCVMAIMYVAMDRGYVQYPIHQLSTRLNCPTECDFRGLVRLTRYLKGTGDFGYWMLAINTDRYPGGIIEVDVRTDSDWVGTSTTGSPSLVSIFVRTDVR